MKELGPLEDGETSVMLTSRDKIGEGDEEGCSMEGGLVDCSLDVLEDEVGVPG